MDADFEEWHSVMRNKFVKVDTDVKQLDFIIGIQGTIAEHRWRWNLTTVGIHICLCINHYVHQALN
jgi:hypothetical protein